MARIESYAPGNFCWAELATSDAAAAKKFYGDLFGWEAVDVPMPEGVYTLFQAEGNDAAAVRTAGPGEPVHWGVYFSVASADESAAEVERGGGRLLAGPMDAHDAGRMAVALDPQGAAFSLWEAREKIGATHGGPLGRVMWPELATPDAAGAAKFYGRLFGWRTTPENIAEDTPYAEWAHSGASIGGLMPMQGDQWAGIPPHWLIYITVADCAERTARAEQLGAKVRVPPTDIPNVGRFALIFDPAGAAFSLIQMTALQRPATA